MWDFEHDRSPQYDLWYQRSLALLSIAGALCIFAPVILLGLPHWIKVLFMIVAIVDFAIATIISIQYPARSKLAVGRERATQELRQNEIAAQSIALSTSAEMSQEWNLAHRIYLESPPGMGVANLRRYGLGHWISYYYPELYQENPLQPAPIAPTRVSTGVQGFNVVRDDIDTSWLTPEFAERSKFVVAGRGSGKTCFLHWQAQTIAANQNDGDRLIIIDGHLIASQMEAADKAGLEPGSRIAVWGLFETAEEEADFIIHDPQKSQMILESLWKETSNKLSGRVPIGPKTHLIVDESDGAFFTSELNSANGAAFVECYRLIVNEARKTRTNATVVAHTFKKGRTGLDSSDVEQVTWIALGSALSASNIKLPSSLDVATLTKERELMQNSLNDSIGRAVILKEEHEGHSSARIVVMPPPKEPQIIARTDQVAV